jgi:probable O-glycosylation ligase (exosortase A-associated)
VRDIALALIFAILIPAIFLRPWLGPLVWAWVSMMNPHRLTFGFAYSTPFAQIVAGATLISFVYYKDKKPFPVSTPTVFLVLFVLWTTITTIFAINNTGGSFETWQKVFKIHLMLWITLVMISGRQQITWLVWVITFSVGIYGIKGGIWTVATGGGSRVWGPPGSFIEGNNELALALTIVLPLMIFLRGEVKNSWGRHLMTAAMVCIGFSILGSYSRGAFLAIIVMALFLGLKSSRPLLMPMVTIAILGVLAAFMPDSWTNRMGTIQSHEDNSAQSRLQTWRMIWNLALHRPINGGGFDIATPEVWATYAVEPWTRAYSAHSIYFQALGEHGFVGLFLFLAIGISTWRLCSKIIREAKGRADLEWAVRLLRSIQISLICFATGGAFLNLVNYDLPYYLAGIVALVWRDIRQELSVSPRKEIKDKPLIHSRQKT